MAKGLVNESSLNSIAEAINVLNGTEGTYTPSEMGDAIIDAIPTEIASGSMITINDAANYPAESVVTTLEPVQEGSGDPSPDNVRPITGYTGVEVTRTGKNLLSRTGQSTVSIAGVLWQVGNDGTSITAVRQSENGNQSDYSYIIGLELLPGTYIFSFATTTGSGSSYQANVKIDGVSHWGGDNYSFTLSEKASIDIIIRYYSAYTQQVTFYPMIRLATDTDPTFEPYTPETHSVTFPTEAGTVYGGIVDLVSGVLTVTNVSVDLGSLSWTYYGAGVYFNADLSPVPQRPASVLDVTDSVSSIYKAVSANVIMYTTSGHDNVFAISTSNDKLIVRDMRFTIADDLKEAVKGQTLCYKLATPQTYQLTPQQIELLKLKNNIWADNGDTSVTYKVDLATYIDELKNNTSVSSASLQNASLNSLGLNRDDLVDNIDLTDENETAETDITENEEI